MFLMEKVAYSSMPRSQNDSSWSLENKSGPLSNQGIDLAQVYH